MKPLHFLLPIAVVSLVGCAAAPKDGKFSVSSDPLGAEVFVMGESKGKTPVALSVTEVFPNIYPPEKQSVYGRILLRHPGCKDRVYPVGAGMLSYGLKAKLECETAAIPQHSAQTIQERLDILENLYRGKSISEEEYKAQRRRILNEL